MGREPALRVHEQVGLVGRGPETGLHVDGDAVQAGHRDDHPVAGLLAAHDHTLEGAGLELLVDLIFRRALPAEGIVLLGAQLLLRQAHQRGPRNHQGHRPLCVGGIVQLEDVDRRRHRHVSLAPRELRGNRGARHAYAFQLVPTNHAGRSQRHRHVLVGDGIGIGLGFFALLVLLLTLEVGEEPGLGLAA